MRLRLALAALAAAPSAYACACCGEKDQWFQFTDRLDTHEVNRVQFGSLAYVFPDTERIDGIKGPFASYEVVVKKAGRT